MNVYAYETPAPRGHGDKVSEVGPSSGGDQLRIQKAHERQKEIQLLCKADAHRRKEGRATGPA